MPIESITPGGFSLPIWSGATVQVAKVFAATDDAQTVADGLAAGQTADGGYTLQTGDVVLAVTASPFRSSGIYVVGAQGGTRHSALDDPAEFVPNMVVTIAQGAWAGKTFRYAGPANPTLGTTGVPWVQLAPVPITPPPLP